MSNDNIQLPKNSHSITHLESNNTPEPIQQGKFQDRVVTTVSSDVLESRKSNAKRDLSESLYFVTGNQNDAILSIPNKVESVQALMSRSVRILDESR